MKTSRYRKEAPPVRENGPKGLTNRGTNPGLSAKTGSPIADIPGSGYGDRHGVVLHSKAEDGVEDEKLHDARSPAVADRKPLNTGTTAGLPPGSRGKYPVANPPSIHD